MLNNTMKSLNTKKSLKKGFTLMEMLIVVAIIAILVAIAIPTFTSSLNKAKVAADEANARSIYAVLTADYMTNGSITTYPTMGTSGNTVTYGGTTYKFSDKTTSFEAKAGSDGAPTVSVTTNKEIFTFPSAKSN